MTDLKQPAPVATLIGDVVRSRSSADRSDLHARLAGALEEANALLRPSVPLRITVGAEFQGCIAAVGEAVHASLWLLLRLAPVQLRHGVGWGAVAVLEDQPRVEDGPGWWAAREAIETVKSEESRATTRLLRTAYRRAEDVEGPDPAPVNAALMCRDQMIGSLSERSVRVLSGLLDGSSQVELATVEGISA